MSRIKRSKRNSRRYPNIASPNRIQREVKSRNPQY